MRSMYKYQGAGKTETGVMGAIRERRREGAMVSGTSAGIEVLQDGVIIEGGRSYESLKYEAVQQSDIADSDWTVQFSSGSEKIVETDSTDVIISSDIFGGEFEPV